MVYCHQGHSHYVDEVRREVVYELGNYQCPWKNHDLCAQEYCEVTDISFCVGPPTLCEIVLTTLEAISTESKVTFSFK